MVRFQNVKRTNDDFTKHHCLVYRTFIKIKVRATTYSFLLYSRHVQQTFIKDRPVLVNSGFIHTCTWNSVVYTKICCNVQHRILRRNTVWNKVVYLCFVCLPRVQRVEGFLQQRPEGCQVSATSCPVVAVPTHLLLHSPTCSHPTPLFHTGIDPPTPALLHLQSSCSSLSYKYSVRSACKLRARRTEYKSVFFHTT